MLTTEKFDAQKADEENKKRRTAKTKRPRFNTAPAALNVDAAGAVPFRLRTRKSDAENKKRDRRGAWRRLRLVLRTVSMFKPRR